MDPVSIMTRFAPGKDLSHEKPGFGFKLVGKPITHRRYQEAMFRIAELHVRRRNYGTGGGLLLTGPSGAGKSTMVRAYYATFPRQHLAERTYVPVLQVSVPSSPTARSLASAILEALGLSTAHRGTAPEKTSWIYDLFAKCGVEMVILDEFQHLFYTPTLNAFRDVTDWLKNLLEETQVGMIACGLPAAEMVVNSNEQLTRRFSERVRITPFSLDEAADFLEFRGVLKELEARLPLPCEVPLHEANLARRLQVGSYGLFDYVMKILEGAVSAAITTGSGPIDLPQLAAGFRTRVWRDVPDRLNPFHIDSLLRPLDRPGEVFHLHSREDLTGSPVARKLGIKLPAGGK